jgi:hypothetical protein
MSPSRRQLMALPPEERAIYKKWLRRALLVYGAVAVMLLTAISAHQYFRPADNLAANDPSRSTVGATRR